MKLIIRRNNRQETLAGTVELPENMSDRDCWQLCKDVNCLFAELYGKDFAVSMFVTLVNEEGTRIIHLS